MQWKLREWDKVEKMTKDRQFIHANGNFTNKTGYWIYIIGYTGSYTISDPNNTAIGSLISSIPAGLIPPDYTLSGGTNFYGILIKFEDLIL